MSALGGAAWAWLAYALLYMPAVRRSAHGRASTRLLSVAAFTASAWAFSPLEGWLGGFLLALWAFMVAASALPPLERLAPRLALGSFALALALAVISLALAALGSPHAA